MTKRPIILGQFHDESINRMKDTPEERQAHTECLKWAIGKVNEKLKLNIDLDVDVQFGSTYAQIH
jgi:DNA polymerase I-like protein with 3'-5' exonuclease and polymerase domains